MIQGPQSQQQSASKKSGSKDKDEPTRTFNPMEEYMKTPAGQAFIESFFGSMYALQGYQTLAAAKYKLANDPQMQAIMGPKGYREYMALVDGAMQTMLHKGLGNAAIQQAQHAPNVAPEAYNVNSIVPGRGSKDVPRVSGVSNATNYAANLEKVAGAQADVDANYQALQRLAHMNDDSGLNWNKNPRPAMPALDNPKEWAHLKDILRPDQQQVVIDQMQKRIQLGDGYTSRGKSAKDIADWNKANLYSSEAAANSAMQSKLKESGRGTFLAEGE